MSVSFFLHILYIELLLKFINVLL